MSVDALTKLWDKGGAALVMIVLAFLLLRFIGKRFVTSMDGMAKAQTESMTKIADSVNTSSAAQVVALGKLTDRVSRIEGKVETLGQLAITAAGPGFKEQHQTKVIRDAKGHPQAVAMASLVEVFDEQENTPIHGVEKFDPPDEAIPQPIIGRAPSRPVARIPTPPQGHGVYGIPRAKTNKP